MATLYVENVPKNSMKRCVAARAPGALDRRGGPCPAGRKRPHGSRIEGEARLAAQTRSDAREATELQPGVSLY